MNNFIIDNKKCLAIYNEMTKESVKHIYDKCYGTIYESYSFASYYYDHTLVAILDTRDNNLYDVSEVSCLKDKFIGHYQAELLNSEVREYGAPAMIVYVSGFTGSFN